MMLLDCRQFIYQALPVNRGDDQVDLDVAARLKSIAPCIHQSLHLARVVKLDEDTVRPHQSFHGMASDTSVH